MSSSPSPTPDKLWDVLPQIVGQLRNEFLLFTFGYIILIIAIGVFAPGIVDALGRELFYLLVALAFASYVGLRIADVWSKKRETQPASAPQPPPEKPNGDKPPAPPNTETPPPTPGSSTLPQKQLLDLLDRHFKEDELREFCYSEMNIDYENLGGEGKRGKARELVAYCERRSLLPRLVETIRRARPDIPLE